MEQPCACLRKTRDRSAAIADTRGLCGWRCSHQSVPGPSVALHGGRQGPRSSLSLDRESHCSWPFMTKDDADAVSARRFQRLSCLLSGPGRWPQGCDLFVCRNHELISLRNNLETSSLSGVVRSQVRFQVPGMYN